MTKRITMAAATAGHAEGGTPLNAFDNALLAAGIGNINLVKISSILPPEVPDIELPKIKLGALIPTAYAAMTSEKPGETVAAAVGYAIPDDPAKNGVIMEFHGYATREHAELTDGPPPRENIDSARTVITSWSRPALLPSMLDGDHTATAPVIEAVLPSFPDLRTLQLDAHPDTREEFLGEPFNYASAMARVMDVVGEDRVWQVGIRTGSREEWERERPHVFPAHAIHPYDAVRRLLPEPGRHPLYVTIDVDVLDPSEAPGTGSPEPGGLRVPELVEIVRLLSQCRVIGGDLVEVAQAWDPSGRTGIAASCVIREAMLTWWGDIR